MILLAIVWLCNCLLTFSFKKCWEGGLRLGAFTLSKVIVSLTKIQCILDIFYDINSNLCGDAYSHQIMPKTMPHSKKIFL